MAHKSRLGTVIFDCRTDDLDSAAHFWSKALGCPIHRSDNPEDTNYVGLAPDRDDLAMEVQKVDHESRVHIDIETDDIEAEVARLEALGAKKLERIRTWVVMEAPTGQRFCVVGPQTKGFAEKAKAWD